MELISKLKDLLIRIWRTVINSILGFLRQVLPEPVKKVISTILHWYGRKITIHNREILQLLLQENHADIDSRNIIIFPPAIEWNHTLFQRPQQLAIALAKKGALVFYIQPKPDSKKPPFELIQERLYLCNVYTDTFKVLANPLIYLLCWNSNFGSLFNHPRILYDYIDEIDVFDGDPKRNLKGHQYLLNNADYVLATARKLLDDARKQRPDVVFSPNGVAYELFARTARREYSFPPEDLVPILSKSVPIIGYYGALARWFDYELFKRVALLRPNYQFVLIGPDYDGTIGSSGIPIGENIHWLGVKTYYELPQYLQYFDVATIPFIINDITHATSPLKLFEYMAGEKPVVITPMQESMGYPGVLVGEGPTQFAEQIDLALKMREDQAYLSVLRQTALENTWEHRADEILALIEQDDRHLITKI